jgi:uncharacterized protein YdhG (YjbR/CyaY superfamily)
MTTNAVNSVDDYIALQPRAAQAALERVRAAIRKAVPGTEEAISYRMPTFKLNGEALLYLAGWKRHYSLYPCAGPIVEAFKEELRPYDVNNKGTIRFPLAEPVPVTLIHRLARFRASEIRRLEKASKDAHG